MKKTKKPWILAIWYLILFALVAIGCMSCTKSQAHDCPFDLCPYKGYESFPGVIDSGHTDIDHTQDGTENYLLNELHFLYPYASYDDLESLIK